MAGNSFLLEPADLNYVKMFDFLVIVLSDKSPLCFSIADMTVRCCSSSEFLPPQLVSAF